MAQTEIAAALGKSNAWVTKYKQRGMPVHDAEAARRWCAQNLRARVQASPSPAVYSPPMPTPPPAHDPIAAAEVDADDYGVWRARREAMAAQRAELDLAKASGELVEVAKVRAEFAKALAAIRDGMLGIPWRMGSVLAAESDPRRVQALLDREIRAAIGEAVK